MADAWLTLGLERGADDADIVAAYKRRAKLLSPDIHGDDPDAAAELAQVKAAFYTLMDVSDVKPAKPSLPAPKPVSAGWVEHETTEDARIPDSWEPPPSRSFGEAFKFCMTDGYAKFSGRASRSEFWLFIFANFLINAALQFALITAIETQSVGLYNFASIAAVIWPLVTVTPILAVGFRRMHDTKNSGLWMFVPLFNIIGALMPGTEGPNRFDA